MVWANNLINSGNGVDRPCSEMRSEDFGCSNQKEREPWPAKRLTNTIDISKNSVILTVLDFRGGSKLPVHDGYQQRPELGDFQT